jgi:hypothetical protein
LRIRASRASAAAPANRGGDSCSVIVHPQAPLVRHEARLRGVGITRG